MSCIPTNGGTDARWRVTPTTQKPYVTERRLNLPHTTILQVQSGHEGLNSGTMHAIMRTWRDMHIDSAANAGDACCDTASRNHPPSNPTKSGYCPFLPAVVTSFSLNPSSKSCAPAVSTGRPEFRISSSHPHPPPRYLHSASLGPCLL